MALLIFEYIASIVTAVGLIIVARRWFWWVLFRSFPTLFLHIASFSIRFAVLAVIGLIIFAWWWVWQWWVWLRVLWYVRFSIYFLWFRWLCQWLRFWGFCYNRSRFQVWRCYIYRVCTNSIQVQRWSNRQNIFALKFLICPPNFKISFIAIFLVLPCRTHSYHCRFSKNMIQSQPMESICWPFNPGSGSTKDTEFIRFVDGRYPQIHKLWCIGLYNITQQVYLTAQVEVVAGTVG